MSAGEKQTDVWLRQIGQPDCREFIHDSKEAGGCIPPTLSGILSIRHLETGLDAFVRDLGPAGDGTFKAPVEVDGVD